jgi:aminoglycoside phosphotransferase (APT) family kinase protein
VIYRGKIRELLVADESNGISVLRMLVGAHVPGDPDRIDFRPCVTGKFNTSWYVETEDRRLVLRISPPDDRERLLFYECRMMRQEPPLHALVSECTEVPIPAIVAADFERTHFDRDYLIMERMPGSPISGLSLDRRGVDRVLNQVGQALRQVHAIREEQYGYIGKHAPMPPQPDWRDAFVIMWNRLLDDIVRCGGYTDEEADHLRRLLDKHLSVFDRQAPAGLLHMDIWAENILADERGNLTGLLDWDRALFGDPEIEFAVLDYCGISEPAFWEGYGSKRDTSQAAEIRRVFYLLYELQKYIFIRRMRDGAAAAADRFKQQSLQLARHI